MFVLFTILVSPTTAIADTNQPVLVTTYISEIIIHTDSAVQAIGFTVDGVSNVNHVPIAPGGSVVISLLSLPEGKILETSIRGTARQELTAYSVTVSDVGTNVVYLTLSLGTSTVPPTETPTVTPTPTPSEPDTPSPSEPVRPDVPDTPGTPDTPGADTPGSDEPGSDKPGSDEPGLDEPGSDGPFVPILPPAGSVYNIAGFIPLAAGFLLLFLLVFWRRKVYRLLKHHAKQHGEKPEKQQLKATAAAVVALLQNKELYPEWRKNKETLARLLADIERALDETQYPQSIPREPVVTDIIKAAKGRINRYRL